MGIGSTLGNVLVLVLLATIPFIGIDPKPIRKIIDAIIYKSSHDWDDHLQARGVVMKELEKRQTAIYRSQLVLVTGDVQQGLAVFHVVGLERVGGLRFGFDEQITMFGPIDTDSWEFSLHKVTELCTVMVSTMIMDSSSQTLADYCIVFGTIKIKAPRELGAAGGGTSWSSFVDFPGLWVIGRDAVNSTIVGCMEEESYLCSKRRRDCSIERLSSKAGRCLYPPILEIELDGRPLSSRSCTCNVKC